ncbi:MAG: thrombospondin type 3 repeat-containing protein [Luteolibacter sp.]
MNTFPNSGYRVFLHSAAGFFHSFILFIFLAATAHAIIDFNNNGVSDLWEIRYNSGDLFANFNPTADPDGDGWSNGVEAISGTDPFDSNPPTGFVRPAITHIPAVYTTDANGELETVSPETAKITWLTRPGKLYVLQVSTDLAPASWLTIDDELIGKGLEITQYIQLTQPDGSKPDRLFFRISIQDTDSDGDNLTDAEERDLGTNTHSASPGSDVVTPTYDVYYDGLDADDYDPSDDDGTHSGHIANIGSGPILPSTYAPVFKWETYSRSLYYHAREDRVEGEMVVSGTIQTHASWDSSLSTSTSLSDFIPPGSLAGSLPAFPSVNFPVPGSLGPSGFAYRNDSSVDTDGSGVASLRQVRARLTCSAPFATAVTKNLLVVRRSSGGGGESINVTSRSFTIPANQTVSASQEFGTEFVPAGNTTVITDCSMLRFAPGYLQNGEGWDDTAPELWQSVGVGESVASKVVVTSNSFNNDVSSRLEVVIAEGGSSTFVSLSNINWHLNGCNFTINGLLPTTVSGAQVILRLRDDPTAVLDTMRVHVFPKRTIPVTIFRIWDSRKPHSWVSGGISNGQIKAALENAFAKQANVTFKVTRTSIVNLKRNPKKPFWQGDDPLYFTNDGSFDNLKLGDTFPGFNAAWDFTHSLTPPPATPTMPMVPTAKYTIHVVKEFLNSSSMGGATFGFNLIKDQTTFIPSSAAKNTVIHEAGHAIGLATRNAGPEGKHDLGNWPAQWNTDLAVPSRNSVGLMHTHALTTVVPWIRREDWRAANLSAPDLE